MSRNNSGLKTSDLEIATLNKPGIANFAKERNLLLNKSKSEWVFFIDSDETLSRRLRDEINNLQLKIYNEFSGYKIIRNNYFLGQYIGTDKIVRLGRKGKGLWKRRVHEVWEIEGKIGELKNQLLHMTAKNLHGYIGKINNYSTIHAEENLKEGKSSNLFKIIFYPIAKFVITLIKSKNTVFSIMQSFHSFLAWSKAWQYQKK